VKRVINWRNIVNQYSNFGQDKCLYLMSDNVSNTITARGETYKKKKSIFTSIYMVKYDCRALAGDVTNQNSNQNNQENLSFVLLKFGKGERVQK
jgi:hypothetical protein